MDDPTKAPSSQELLNRITRLETDNADLKVRCDDLLNAFKAHLDSNFNDFSELNDLVYPLVEKAFPKFFATLRKVKEIIPGGYADPSVDTRPKDYKRD